MRKITVRHKAGDFREMVPYLRIRVGVLPSTQSLKPSMYLILLVLGEYGEEWRRTENIEGPRINDTLSAAEQEKPGDSLFNVEKLDRNTHNRRFET